MNYSKGFALPLLLIIVAVLIIAGGAYAYMQNKQVKQPDVVYPSAQVTTASDTCTPKFVVESGPELTASEFYSDSCYEQLTKQTCDKIDIYDAASKSFGTADGTPDCKWSEDQ